MHRRCTGDYRKSQDGTTLMANLCIQCERRRDQGPWDLAGHARVMQYADGAQACRTHLASGGWTITMQARVPAAHHSLTPHTESTE
jgi:hypothetical protein